MDVLMSFNFDVITFQNACLHIVFLSNLLPPLTLTPTSSFTLLRLYLLFNQWLLLQFVDHLKHKTTVSFARKLL